MPLLSNKLCFISLSRIKIARLSSSQNLIQSLLTMPRESKVTPELRNIRLKIKQKGLKYAPGTVTLQILGSGAYGAPTSLYVFTDQSRYLFNVGEGSQRLAHEHKMKLSKLEHIFITYPCWENIGGLPGVALTIQDVGVPEITIHGPEGTNDIFPATRRFVVLKDLSVKMADMTNGFEDNVMSVKYVPISSTVLTKHSKSNFPSEEADDVDYYSHERRISGKEPSPAIVEHSPLLPVKERIPSVAMSYICKVNGRPGTLSLEACVDHGVPPGPLLGKLKNGEDITLPNGKIVKSCDVTAPDDPGTVFIVVDCPGEDFLPSLTKNGAFEAYQCNAEDEELVADTVIHFSPANIVCRDDYKKWMAKFPPSTTHILINNSNICTGSVAVHRIQYKLNLLHPEIFPLLKENGMGTIESKETLDSRLVHASTMMAVHLRPKKGLDLSQTLKIEPSIYLNEPFNTEVFREELSKFHSLLKSFPVSEESYPKIVFLGTGSCIPNKTRNTSGILIHTSPEDCVIFDCGEGTFNQILRFYGCEKGKQVMNNLKMIYVSHLHADHHIGLLGLLKGRRKLLNGNVQPIYLIAPQQIMFWLKFYDVRFEDVLSEFCLIPSTALRGANSFNQSKELEEAFQIMQFDNIGTVPVRHCPNSFGVSVTHRDGWKLTYSGDTMPCQDLVALGLDSDILIHEATMEDELEKEARLKFHSTTSQAIGIGRAMRAKYTLLTHFSQRYAKLPRMKESCDDNIGIAFDNMEVSMDQLPLLSKMYPTLKMMFVEDCEEMEAKAARRNLKLELKRTHSLSPDRGNKIKINS